MKNKSVLIVIFAMLIILCICCFFIFNNSKDHATVNTSTTANSIIKKEVTIEDFKNMLIENELSITNITEKASALIGAVEGVGYEIDGDIIEIYKFNEKSSEELTKNNIKSAKSEGTVSMPSFGNTVLKVKYNKGLCLINYENHPDKEKILEIFNNL